MPNQYNNPQNKTEEERNRIGEEELQFQRERAAENSGTANGLIIGGILLALVGMGAATAYYLQRPAPTPTTIINTSPSPTAAVSPAPEKQTTIIDRTVEKTAPPKVKVVEVEKPVLVPVPSTPKVVEVPGPTKIIEVPRPVAAPATPTTTDKSEPPKLSPTPSATPSPAASDSEPINVPSPDINKTGNN